MPLDRHRRRDRVVTGTPVSTAGSPTAWGRLARQVASIRTDLALAVLDCGLAVAAYTALQVTEVDFALPAGLASGFRLFLALAVVAHLLTNWAWGLYGQMWRHASVQEARRVVLAGATATLVLFVASLPMHLVRPAVVLLGAATTTMLMGGLRFQARLFAFRRNAHLPRVARIAVIGAGESGAAIVREMLRSPDSELQPVAVFDDDPRKQGRSLLGVPVLGGIRDLGEAVRRYGAEQALLAIPSADGELVRQVARAADEAGLTLKVLPSVNELVNGKVSVGDVRDLQITDLLGRSQVSTDLESVRGILEGKRVLITGGGGWIGSEIARQVAACRPDSLILLDHDETHLYDAATELNTDGSELVLHLALTDIRDRDELHEVFERYKPEVVFHAAAHKHVPLLESHPREAITTNVLGTQNVLDASVKHDVERFVLISTDKAVRPACVMGASKRLAEQLMLENTAPGRRYCAVRFGNVLGSRGSVIPLFMRQIERGGPVTVTDPRMTRFFMSTSEAVQLVLQAAVFAEGGEVFMLEMGEPVRIMDLAERMIRLSGRRVGQDIAIRITGPRPGEKLAEELVAPEEVCFPTPHPSILAVHPPRLAPDVLEEGIERLSRLAVKRDEVEAAAAIMELAGQPASLVVLPDDGSSRTLPVGSSHGSV